MFLKLIKSEEGAIKKKRQKQQDETKDKTRNTHTENKKNLNNATTNTISACKATQSKNIQTTPTTGRNKIKQSLC